MCVCVCVCVYELHLAQKQTLGKLFLLRICFSFYFFVLSIYTLPAVQKTQVRSLGREDPWRRKWQLTPVFILYLIIAQKLKRRQFPQQQSESSKRAQCSCHGKSHRQRSVAGYSPWGRKKVGHHLVTKQQSRIVTCFSTRTLFFFIFLFFFFSTRTLKAPVIILF